MGHSAGKSAAEGLPACTRAPYHTDPTCPEPSRVTAPPVQKRGLWLGTAGGWGPATSFWRWEHRVSGHNISSPKLRVGIGASPCMESRGLAPAGSENTEVHGCPLGRCRRCFEASRATIPKFPARRVAERWDLVGSADTDIREGWGNRCIPPE